MPRKVHNELLDHRFELTAAPKRIISLLSSAIDKIDKTGFTERVVGASAYCDRHIPNLKAPVIGEYLNCDIAEIKAQHVAERNWNSDTPVIVSTVDCGQNVIQEGPSFLDTAEWLQNKLLSLSS